MVSFVLRSFLFELCCFPVFIVLPCFRVYVVLLCCLFVVVCVCVVLGSFFLVLHVLYVFAFVLVFNLCCGRLIRCRFAFYVCVFMLLLCCLMCVCFLCVVCCVRSPFLCSAVFFVCVYCV